MTAVNVETGEVVDVMSAEDAERITLRISLKLGSLADTYEAVMPMIRDAIVRQAHAALGYPSPGAYISDRFGDSLSRLGAEMRRDVVSELSAAGMSTRAIASVVRVHHDTVASDRKAGVGNPTPEPKWVSATEALAFPKPEPEPAKVVGLDGKTYTRPAPAPAPPVERQVYRRPLADGFRDASLDLAKVVARVENLVADDRLAKNKNEVARYANDLIRARDALQRAVDIISI